MFQNNSRQTSSCDAAVLTPYIAATELDLNLLVVGCRIITIEHTFHNATAGPLVSY